MNVYMLNSISITLKELTIANEQELLDMQGSTDDLTSMLLNVIDTLNYYSEDTSTGVFGVYISNELVGVIDGGYFDDIESVDGYMNIIINNLAIKGVYRSLGIGKFLVYYLAIHFINEEDSAIKLYADSLYASSHSFYKHLGFRDEAMLQYKLFNFDCTTYFKEKDVFVNEKK